MSGAPAGITLRVAGVGLLGPGLDDWASGRLHLLDPSDWSAQPTRVPAPQRLPATERRRAGAVVRASVAVADQALLDAAAAGVAPGLTDPGTLATVFTSSTGDPLNCHLLCEALAQSPRVVSPTRFTNSVHNAAAGYWHIATRSMAASTSLAAFDASFGAGLLEAAVQCQQGQTPVLLVAADVPYPEPLHALRPLSDSFAVALLLLPDAPVTPATGSADPPAAGRRLHLEPASETQIQGCPHAGLEALRLGIPAARSLPLLQALAAPSAAACVLEAAPGLALKLTLSAVASAP